MRFTPSPALREAQHTADAIPATTSTGLKITLQRRLVAQLLTITRGQNKGRQLRLV